MTAIWKVKDEFFKNCKHLNPVTLNNYPSNRPTDKTKFNTANKHSSKPSRWLLVRVSLFLAKTFHIGAWKMAVRAMYVELT